MDNLPKPAYVRFEERPVEDREASIAQGRVVYKDVLFAIITPAGTKDVVEKEVDAWMDSLKEGAQQERIPSEWVHMYEKALERWKETREDPEFGASLKTATFLTQSQLNNCLSANVRTVEELAQANEETLSRIGMGGRALKAKAQAFLDAVATGGASQELEALRVKNEELEARNADITTKMEAMAKRLEALEKVES
jgi:hypothetical protein